MADPAEPDTAPAKPAASSHEPRTVQPPRPLDRAERRKVLFAALAPIPVVALLLAPFAVFGEARWSNVVGAAFVYGSLISLASGFVAVDRMQNRQCPACRSRNERGVWTCVGCGYDLEARPRFACGERHRVHLDPGLCECGRRLAQLPTSGGIGREIMVILRIGAWMLAFLVGMGVLFRLAGG